MFKRSHLLAPFLLAFVVLLAACGGGGSSATASTSPTSTPQPTDQAAGQLMSQTTEQTGIAPADASAVTPVVGDSGVGAPATRPSSLAMQNALSTVDVVRILKPSVVQVVTEIAAMGSFNQPGPGRGVGTGVILDVQGNILTNNHVIADAQSIMVTLNNGDTFTAELIGGDASTDVAVIRIRAQGLQPAKLGRSADLLVGEEVIAIGHALGLPGGPTVSKGVVSALGRSIDTDPQTTMVDLIQTDASINPGNSGGPLANTDAEVIGINTAVIPGSQGIGFAINIDDARIVVEQLMQRGYVNRGFLGISPINLSAAIASQVGVPIMEGIVIARLVPDSPAVAAGLRPEDVIVKLGEVDIANTGELSRFLVAHPPGETVDVVFYRRNQKQTVTLTLGERPK